MIDPAFVFTAIADLEMFEILRSDIPPTVIVRLKIDPPFIRCQYNRFPPEKHDVDKRYIK